MSLKEKWKSWVRMFDIPDINKHEKGFTIYKIISILYPEACPDAVTKVVVWKRFNDIKCLQKEVKVLQKKLNIKDPIPSLPKSVIFKRFEDETINNRKRAILNLLDYIGKHSALFTSPIVVKFFESSHTPVLGGNINTIRAKLNLPEETDFSINSDEDKISDTDSFTSSNLGSIIQSVDQIPDTSSKPNTNLRKLNSMTSIDSHSSKTSEYSSILNTENSLLLLDGQYQLVNSSATLDDNIQYLVDASVHINLATELETEKKYEEAFSAYKTAVEILISGGQNDSMYDRKRMVKYKTEKYLIRAEKIYNMYLAPEVKDLMSAKRTEADKPNNIVKGPLFNLYKYKVIKIISSSGMLVLHSENQQIYYIKVIHKTVQFLNDHLILPEGVPYMMKLVNHYNSDYALFLVLEYCNDVKLIDYVKNESLSSEVRSNKELLQNIQEQSDNESEMSFSELLNEYASTRDKANNATTEKVDSDSDSFIKVDHDVTNVPNIFDKDIEQINQPVLDITHANIEQSMLLTERQLSNISNIDSDEAIGYNNAISELQIVKWGAQLLIALEKLHSIGVVCRDLCMDNLFLDENKNLLLSYMCNVKELCDLYTKGINIDLAPEVYGFEEITVAADWWSFGAILYELLVGLPLSKIHTNGVTNYTHIKIPKYVSPEAKSLLRQLLIYEPSDRIGVGVNGTQHLKSHPFFRSVTWESL